MKRAIVLGAVLLALLTGCTDHSHEIDTITLYDGNGAAVGHYQARYDDWWSWNAPGIRFVTITGQWVTWQGQYLIEGTP